jgi:DtxR family Mn-dependent transcriptional regulator
LNILPVLPKLGEICSMGSLTEENYIKSLYSLSQKNGEVSVSELAKKLHVKLPTVNSMIKKLATKKLVAYAPYQGIRLTEKGKREALSIVRKHRLAELFLVKVMGLGWEEVHDIAEQLEHVDSERFYNRIDELLGHPKADPHGEPIPDVNGKIISNNLVSLSEVEAGTSARISAVGDDEKTFLDHLNTKGLQIGDRITVKKKELFDGSLTIVNKARKETMLTHQVAERIWVEV